MGGKTNQGESNQVDRLATILHLSIDQGRTNYVINVVRAVCAVAESCWKSVC
jgi:hypothetical protein